MQYLVEYIEWFEIHSNILANDVALLKDNYVMGFKSKHRKIALGGSVGALMLTQLAQRNFNGALRVGVFSTAILGYVLCPEIYNALL